MNDDGKQRIINDGDRRVTVTHWDADENERVSVTIDERQFLTDWNMRINDLGDTSGLDAQQVIEFCADQLKQADRFQAPVSWQTGVVPGLSVEEIIGAIISADRELRWLQDENHELQQQVEDLRKKNAELAGRKYHTASDEVRRLYEKANTGGTQ